MRLPKAASWCSAVLVAACSTSGSAEEHAPADGADGHDARQIVWQRTLDDALALARAEDRPLLLALNMDGESASDRIVVEEYRDPAFVESTRPFVCLVGTVFRHAPRDHDDAGRRIPCPRLGGVTCGEHIALEPLVYERYLADGERVAPRHALVLPDGTKAFDVSLSYDLLDIDRAVAAGAAAERTRRATLGLARAPAAPAAGWAELAARRDDPGRARLEQALAAAPTAELGTALLALGTGGDAGTIDALRVVAARLAGSPELGAPLVTCARALGLEAGLAEVLRGRVQLLGDWPFSAQVREPLLPLLAELDGASARTRSFLLACLALAEHADARAALERALGAEADGVVRTREVLGGPVRVATVLAAAEAVSRGAEALPRLGPVADAMPEESELEDALAALEPELAVPAPTADALARYAKASLDLGRRRIESRGQAAEDLLEDAARHWERALAAEPERAEWWLESARTAWFLGRFEQDVEHARRALALASGAETVRWPGTKPFAAGSLPALLDDGLALEALRWIGDGHARLLGVRSGGDAAAELAGILEGLRALSAVAISPFATPKDWVSLASFAGALGLWREELALARAGAARFPAAPELRQALTAALWNGGRVALAPRLADELAAAHPDSADATWFAGQAWLLAAEELRLAEQPERALAAYAEARARFEACAAARPEYATNCALQVAYAWLGSGEAEARLGDRPAAAECLLEAASALPPTATGAALAGLIDGLGYDGFDLVDKICEWRASGPSDVDPLALSARLAVLRPRDPFFDVALSDSQLREALRADGRNPVRAMRDTVDAAGKPIRMLMGMPDEEGDMYLERALVLARRALPFAQSDEDEKALSQAATIKAERLLERGRLDGVRAALAEAAPLLGAEAPAPEADLRALAARFRAQLGEARPRWRAGR
jgi:tetratricopeptide (TPR) repeat protein